MKGFVLSLLHALLVSVVLTALISLEVSLAAKILLGALSAFLVLLFVLLQKQTERLINIDTTMRSIFVAVETQRLDPKNKRRALEILASDLRQEESDTEIAATLSGSRASGVVYWALYGITVAAMTAMGVAAWPA